MLFKTLQEDLTAFMERDPAARSKLEVALIYPGFHAVLFYRIANALWRRNIKFLANWLSQTARFLTNIEIHPGAQIGRHFVIDHGAGVVVGETTVIGNDVTLYQAVTLGGIAPSVDSHLQRGVKRHPTLEDGVIVGSGAQVLGPLTVGKDSRVGANAVVTKDVPPGTTAVGIPARVVLPKDREHAKDFAPYGTPSDGCPDPVLRTIEDLRAEVAALNKQVADLQSNAAKPKSKPKKVVSGGKS